MITRKVTIEGLEYTVSSSTPEGLERAIDSLKWSLQTIKNKPEEGHGI